MWVRQRASLKDAWQGLFHPIIRKRFHNSPINLTEEGQGQGEGNSFGNQETPPDMVYISGQGKKPGGRDQGDKLASEGYQKRIKAFGKGLEDGSHDNATGCDREMQGNDSEGDDTHPFHICRRVEKGQERSRDQFEGQGSAKHNADCQNQGKFQSLFDPALMSGSEVEGQNRDQTVIQSENRHEEETLQLEIDSEDGGCCRGKGNQDQIHEIGHDGSDAHHEDRRDADIVDPADDRNIGLKDRMK